LDTLLPRVLDGLWQPDVRLADAKSPLRVTHRRLENREVYFVINDSDKAWAGQVEFAAAGNGERWDPATGRLEAKLAGSEAGLSLEPYGAALVRFDSAKPSGRRPLDTASLPSFSLRALPAAEPTTGHGEFVRAELTPDATHAGPGSRAWQAAALLTKGKVDTHLFTRFHYTQPVDLSDADCLAIETWVPNGQATPNQILVIIHEEGGGDFLAETGRSLAAPGEEKTYVALNRFKLAGWSKDADGVLDLKKVGDILVGWGGYLGNEGERVQFSVAGPKAGGVLQGRK